MVEVAYKKKEIGQAAHDFDSDKEGPFGGWQ
jgi:hypothetical protein